MSPRILITLVGSIFVALLGMGIVAPLMPIYATELGATGLTLGLMVAGFSISRGVLQPFIGGMSDKKGKKRFMVAGLVIYSIAGLTYVLASSVEHLILIRLFHGTGSAMVLPIAMAYIGDLAPEGEEGKYMGILNIALFSGIGGGPLLGGLFLDSLGINSAFYAMSAASALAATFVLVFLPSVQVDPSRRTGDGLLTTFRNMLRNNRVLGILLSRLSTMVVMVPTFAFLPILMVDFMDATGLEIGIVISVRTLVNAVFQMPFGRLADRTNRTVLLLIGSVGVSAAMFVIPFLQSYALLIGVFAFMGLAEAIVWPTLGALAAEEGRRYGQGSMMGVFNMAMSAGIFLGSLGTGAMVDAFGLRYAFISVGILITIMSFVAATMMKAPSLAKEQEPAPTTISR